MYFYRSTKVFLFKQLLTLEHNSQKHWGTPAINDCYSCMFTAAFWQLQLHHETGHLLLQKDTEETQKETSTWVCPSKNTAKGDFIVPARRKYPQNMRMAWVLSHPWGHQENSLQCQATAHRSSVWKSKSHPEGTSVYLNASPIIPFYGPRGLGMLYSQETGRDERQVIPFRGL